MNCRGKELISLFLYKICNPGRSDHIIHEHVEQVDELKSEAEELKIFEAEHKRSDYNIEKHVEQVDELKSKAEELNILGRISESNSGHSEEKKTNEIANKDFYLPLDLVVVIFSRLALKENIRSSAVCKTWGEIAASVRGRARSCWLMYLDPRRKSGICYSFFDPIEKKKTKAMGLPWSSNCMRIFCSNDGWLLMGDFSSPSNKIYFFNPFTQERINLPRFEMAWDAHIAFSCAPTKKCCLVFAIRYYDISIWRHGATIWVRYSPDRFWFNHKHAKNVLYADGLFYIASDTELWVFDPSAPSWTVLPVKAPLIMHSPDTSTIRFIAEYKGDIFLVDASSAEAMVFRLNRLQSAWEKKEALDGSSIFVSCGSSLIAPGLTGSMSNIVYIWNNQVNQRRPSKDECSLNCNRPYKYSLYSRSLCEDTEGYYFEYSADRLQGVWIEPPHNISISDFSILEPSDDLYARSREGGGSCSS